MATKLTRLRERRGLSRYRVAKDTGIPFNTLKRIEEHETDSISRENLRRLRDYYGRELTLNTVLQ